MQMRKDDKLCQVADFNAASYVEMLKTQQDLLVTGLQELYRRLNNGLGWIGPPSTLDKDGVPLVHDILERLGVFWQVPQWKNELAEDVPMMSKQNSATDRLISFNGSVVDHFSTFEPVLQANQAKLSPNTFALDSPLLNLFTQSTWPHNGASSHIDPFAYALDYQDDPSWTSLHSSIQDGVQFLDHCVATTLGQP